MGKTKRKIKEEEKDYDVEKIVGKRLYANEIQYFVKWVGYPDEQNTWEPEGNLNCPELISTYEEEHKNEPVPEEEISPEDDLVPGGGFDKNWIPVRVIGATRRFSDKELMVIIRWKNGKVTAEMSEIANEKIPQMVIQYYELRIRWN